jgi:hypothetical protein
MDEEKDGTNRRLIFLLGTSGEVLLDFPGAFESNNIRPEGQMVSNSIPSYVSAKVVIAARRLQKHNLVTGD